MHILDTPFIRAPFIAHISRESASLSCIALLAAGKRRDQGPGFSANPQVIIHAQAIHLSFRALLLSFRGFIQRAPGNYIGGAPPKLGIFRYDSDESNRARF